MADNIISVRTGAVLSREMKDWPKKRIAVEGQKLSVMFESFSCLDTSVRRSGHTESVLLLLISLLILSKPRFLFLFDSWIKAVVLILFLAYPVSDLEKLTTHSFVFLSVIKY